jgi:type 1 fimbria pilin
MYATLTDAQSLTNTSTTLTNATGAGYATGVGVQISYNGTVEKYNGNAAVSITPTSTPSAGQFLLGNASVSSGGSTVYTFPFTANMVQPTATAVTAGNVSAVATFTMSYQ